MRFIFQTTGCEVHNLDYFDRRCQISTRPLSVVLSHGTFDKEDYESSCAVAPADNNLIMAPPVKVSVLVH